MIIGTPQVNHFMLLDASGYFKTGFTRALMSIICQPCHAYMITLVVCI